MAKTTYYQNPYLPHRLRDGSQTSPGRAAPLTMDRDGLPLGTAVQVMSWVDDDPDRAQRFLNKEQEETRPRVSLVSSLKAVLKRHEIVPEEPSGQLAPHIDVIPAERAAIVEGETVDAGPIDPLTLVRDRLGIEQP